MPFAALGFLATAFLAAGFLAATFLAAGFLAAAFLATGFLAATFLAAGFLAATFLATGFLAAGFLVVVLFALLTVAIFIPCKIDLELGAALRATTALPNAHNFLRSNSLKRAWCRILCAIKNIAQQIYALFSKKLQKSFFAEK